MRITQAMLLLIPLLLVGCLSQAAQPTTIPTATPTPPATTGSTATPTIITNASASQNLSDAMNSFALEAYSKLKQDDGNLFFSPFSISTALAMAAEGARGDTRTEMDRVLGLSGNTTTTRSAFATMMNGLNAPNGNYALSAANSLWTQAGYPIKSEFTTALTEYYSAEARSVDFVKDTEGSRMAINDWTAAKTNQKILNLIPQGMIDQATRSVLVNAIYFKGSWAQKFNASYTRDSPFYVNAQQNVTVHMMHIESTTNASYYSDDELRALELDYAGGDLSMLLLLPNQYDGLAGLESSLTVDRIGQIREKMYSTELPVWLPKFNMTKEKELSDTLKEMGMVQAFSDNADFSGITDADNLCISKVVHKAYIGVDEEGTEAAAATAVIMRLTAVLNEPPKPEFKADHPFIFFIVDKRAGTILFMGRVTDPTKAG